MAQTKSMKTAFSFAAVISLLFSVGASAQNEKNTTLMGIKNNCAAKWPGSYRMQKYCVTEEIKALNEIEKIADNYSKDTKEEMILLLCMDKWRKNGGFNFRMIVYCANEELKAYKSLQ